MVYFKEGTQISNILLGIMMLCVVLFVVFVQRLLPDTESDVWSIFWNPF